MLIERMRKRLAADRMSFIEPCLPAPADKPPAGPDWIHEIKHDGFPLMARRDPVGIRLITRRGNDWTNRYPLVVEGGEPSQGAILLQFPLRHLASTGARALASSLRPGEEPSKKYR